MEAVNAATQKGRSCFGQKLPFLAEEREAPAVGEEDEKLAVLENETAGWGRGRGVLYAFKRTRRAGPMTVLIGEECSGFDALGSDEGAIGIHEHGRVEGGAGIDEVESSAGNLIDRVLLTRWIDEEDLSLRFVCAEDLGVMFGGIKGTFDRQFSADDHSCRRLHRIARTDGPTGRIIDGRLLFVRPCTPVIYVIDIEFGVLGDDGLCSGCYFHLCSG